jgi:hypothetical protein
LIRWGLDPTDHDPRDRNPNKVTCGDGLHAPASMMVYWPALMDSFEGERIRVQRSMTFASSSSRTASEGLLKDIQRAVWAAHPSLPSLRSRRCRTFMSGRWRRPRS